MSLLVLGTFNGSWEGDCHQRRMLKFYIRSGLDKDGFQVKYISDFEGFGVFAKEQFKKGEFLLEYFGENISPEEAAVCSKKLDCNMIFLFFIKESNTALMLHLVLNIFVSMWTTTMWRMQTPEWNYWISIGGRNYVFLLQRHRSRWRIVLSIWRWQKSLVEK